MFYCCKIYPKLSKPLPPIDLFLLHSDINKFAYARSIFTTKQLGLQNSLLEADIITFHQKKITKIKSHTTSRPPESEPVSSQSGAGSTTQTSTATFNEILPQKQSVS